MAEEVDIFACENILDVGTGEPLFANFVFEDWALVQLRMEMYFLQLAFRKDVDDDDRPGVHEQHLSFYYNKYFRKNLNPKHFAVNSNSELVALVKDTVVIGEDSQVLVSALADETEEFDIFVKQTEEKRRERQRRIDAGDETAKIKFSPLAVQQSSNVRIAVNPTGGPTAKTPGAPSAKPPAGGSYMVRPSAPNPGGAQVVRPAFSRLRG